jgi:malate dehydrogenase (oxaloacetate-decarboxylating)(NADP+)
VTGVQTCALPICTPDPTPDEIAHTTLLAARHIRRFGLPPKVALLSASNFGSRDVVSAGKMRAALAIVNRLEPELEIDGEMHGDAALNMTVRQRMMPASPLKGEANLLVFPSLDAANITLNLVKAMTDALHVGPILLGAAKVAHVLTPSVTSRGVVNMSTLAAVEAASRAAESHVR